MNQSQIQYMNKALPSIVQEYQKPSALNVDLHSREGVRTEFGKLVKLQLNQSVESEIVSSNASILEEDPLHE